MIVADIAHYDWLSRVKGAVIISFMNICIIENFALITN